jgi:RNA polymerase sigma factor (sigma-70 family)
MLIYILFHTALDNIIQLIEGCANQEPRSQKILYEQFFGYLLKIAFRYVNNYQTAVNVTNDGFVKIFRFIHKFNPAESPYPDRLLMAWMKRILINTAIDDLRKNKNTNETELIPEQVWERADTGYQADNQLLYKELISYIKNLPPSYRVVFNMYVIDGCSHQEIGNKLGISEGTSKSNLSRARNLLQTMIRGNERAVSERKPQHTTAPSGILPSIQL